MNRGPAANCDSLPGGQCPPAAPRASILCINRDPGLADAIEDRVSDLPVDVLRARDGMQGYWLAISKSPALIVTDLRMTNGHGGEIIESVKENPQTRDIPVIVVANHDYPGLQRHAERMGATHCFQKPLEVAALLDAVSEVFALSE